MHPFYQQILLINNSDHINITFFFHFFFLLIYISQTVPLRYLIVDLVKFALCSCVHSFVRGCSSVGK